MWFACELIQSMRDQFSDFYEYVIWTNAVYEMSTFIANSGINEILVLDISEFWSDRKSNIAMSLLHAPIPSMYHFDEKALILRIDYISLDPVWLSHDQTEHMLSTQDRSIIELIPSPLSLWSGLLPPLGWNTTKKYPPHITIFAYKNTLDLINWDSFPEDLIVYICGSYKSNRSNIVSLDLLSFDEFYGLLDNSEFVIIRWEVTFAHIFQKGIPFFWDMYRQIGWFPQEQSDQFLSMMQSTQLYRDTHQILNWQKEWKIRYSDLVWALSHIDFSKNQPSNLIQTIKKHIDRFNNSI